MSNYPIKHVPLTPPQILILGGLMTVLCLICAGTAALLYSNRASLFEPPQPQVAAVPPPAQPPAPTPGPINTPVLTPTFTPVPLPQAAPAAAPSPTATYVVAPEFINKDKIREIIEYVELRRQLALPEKLPLNFLTRRQIQEQWQQGSVEREVLEVVEKQQQFYAAMGLIEPKVDLVQAALDTQNSLVLGYYDPEERMMYVIADSVNMFAQEEMTFAHEYVHALQDHYFGIGALLDRNVSADAQLAARALPEGDARLLEDLFTSENITQDQLNYTVYRYLFQEHLELEGVSPALGIFTYFPYTAGEFFVIYLYLSGGFSWDSVNQAYQNPPVSTEQVMHPEKYLAGEMPVDILLPDLGQVLGGNWREIDRNVLGEAGFLVWLIDQVEADQVITNAAGWGGDSYSLWLDNDGRRLLVELSQWDTDQDAVEFFEGFTAYMNSREGNDAGHTESATRFWEYEEGITMLGRQGRQALILIAPDRATLDGARSRFAGF